MGAPEAGPEGSVSLPGIEVDIMRAPRVRVGFDDADGVRQELMLEGFAARVAQHEIEQMNGVFFLDRLSRLKREAALRRYRKLNR
jgi:peptide deformylase